MENKTTKKKSKKKEKETRLFKRIITEVKKWREILHLSEWRLEIKLDDLSNIDNDDGTKYLAITQMIVPYRKATIIFDVNIQPTEIEIIVIHELIHLIIHPIVFEINDSAADRITQAEKNHLGNLEETAVSRITSIIMSQEKGDDKR